MIKIETVFILRLGALMALLMPLSGCYPGYMEAYPWDESRQCWGPLEEAAFSWSAHGGSHDDAMTPARSPEGEYWLFRSTHIPDDFVTADQSPESDFPQGSMCP
jgi:hypothetical protein